MNTSKQTPPTSSSTTHIDPPILISITQFNEYSSEQPSPSSDPIIILQLSISQLEDSKKRLIQQIKSYQPVIQKVHHLEAENQCVRKELQMVKEQLGHCEEKLAAERKEGMRLRGMVEELEEAIETESKWRSPKTRRVWESRSKNEEDCEESKEIRAKDHPTSAIGSKYINEMYENLTKYFQNLQQKSSTSYQTEITTLTTKLDHLTQQNNQLKHYVRTTNISRCQEQSAEFRRYFQFISSEKMSTNCKNNGCFKKGLYFSKLVGFVMELYQFKKEVEVLRKQYKGLSEEFGKGQNRLQRLMEKDEIECENENKNKKLKTNTKARVRSKSRDNSLGKGKDKSLSINKLR